MFKSAKSYFKKKIDFFCSAFLTSTAFILSLSAPHLALSVSIAFFVYFLAFSQPNRQLLFEVARTAIFYTYSPTSDLWGLASCFIKQKTKNLLASILYPLFWSWSQGVLVFLVLILSLSLFIILNAKHIRILVLSTRLSFFGLELKTPSLLNLSSGVFFGIGLKTYFCFGLELNTNSFCSILNSRFFLDRRRPFSSIIYFCSRLSFFDHYKFKKLS